MQLFAAKGLRATVSAVALLSFTLQPVIAQGKARKDEVLDACSAQRAPLVKLDDDYEQLKRSKMSAAIGEGLKKGAAVIATGVMNGGLTRGGGGFGGFGGGLSGGFGGLVGAVGGLAAQSAAQQASGAPAAGPNPVGMVFGQDMLSGALGLNVPGVSTGSFGGGDNMKAYAALAVLVAIVATAEAYAQLKAQEAGGDLKKASYNIDQDAGRQLSVAREVADSGNALVECRSQQLTDINTRLASASNDKDRKAIKRERTEFIGALKKDIDLTGDVVDQHAGMAKTFTQGRAMTDGSSESAVLGGQAPAYAQAADTTKLAMPATGGQAQVQQASYAPAAPPPELVTKRAAPVRSAPVASSSAIKTIPAGQHVTPKSDKAVGGWWEVDLGGSTGYIRSADLGAAGAGKGGPAKAPAVAGPSNIRDYNKTVIAARETGKDRLSSLMTDIQTSLREESVFYALLERVGLA
jgi:hypothetical protein